MTDEVRRDRGDDERLDAGLRSLPRSIEPGRDLWPGIEARLEPRRSARARPGWSWPAQAAAALLLVAASSLLTARFVDPRRDEGTMTSGPAAVATDAGRAGATVVPAAFGPGARLDPEYVAARHQLTAMLESRVARLPASTRVKLEANLAELRRAADEINVALAGQPGDPLLQELLLKTYQDELAVLANVNQLTDAVAGAAVATPDGKRMQL